MEKEIRLNLRVDAATKREFMEVCRKRAINSSELIRQLIRDWTDKNK